MRATPLFRAAAALIPVATSAGCLVAQTSGAPGSTSASLSTPQADTAGLMLVPPGYGTLRQDDISLHIDAGTVLVRALPLEESVIRLLTPDSYRALRDLKEGSRTFIAATARRYGGRPVSVWLVSFYGVEPGARFTPGDLIVTSGGRDFKPYDVLPLTVGFGENRLRQRETQSALYIYDGDVQVNQPVTLAYQGALDASWDDTLQRVERERAMVRARASKPN
ncbi:MAG TPA: hypothetical protein VGT98_14840 [Candidatus Elarobacter sp.]|nr:hypothetical protein [Candidatus Elarobacter sp.]